MLTAMPLVDISDDTFVRATPHVLSPRLGEDELLRRCLPVLRLWTSEDRGVRGRRWRAGLRWWPRPRITGRWVGTAEVWLEPWHDGTLVHLYVRLDPVRGPAGRSQARRARRLHDSVRRTWKRELHTWKDHVETAHGRATLR